MGAPLIGILVGVALWYGFRGYITYRIRRNRGGQK